MNFAPADIPSQKNCSKKTLDSGQNLMSFLYIKECYLVTFEVIIKHIHHFIKIKIGEMYVYRSNKYKKFQRTRFRYN